MKIGIITLVGNNYGNRLQNYAVQELLRDFGEVYTVKTERKVISTPQTSRLSKLNPCYIKKALDSRLLNIYHLSNRKLNTVTRAAYYNKNKGQLKKAIKDRDAAFRAFDEKYILYEAELLHLTGDDDEPWVRSYDAWVCGSDQIWNPKYPTATRNAFLQFAQKGRRISLAASIGLSDKREMLKEYPEWISGIDYISVREERAAELVKELTGRSAEVFLDPTMLIDRKKWDAIAEAAKAKLPKRYAVGYFLGIREKKYLEYIEKYCREHDLEYVDLLNGEAIQYFSYGPDDVVAAIRGAEICFVDSFHGAVFSILYHKQFVVFQRSEEGSSMNSRLETLLHRFGLEECVFTDKEMTPASFNFEEADLIISEEKKRFSAFLNTAMSNIKQLPKQEAIQEKKHVHIQRKERCTGCTACAMACTKHCITMSTDEEGFVYPVVNEAECIECGKCKAVCPVIHNEGGNTPQKVLAEKNKNEHIRLSSSSGGTFTEAALAIIAMGGVVYGCAMDNDMVARHIRVDNPETMERLKSSKYVQSDMGDVMACVKEDLLNGKTVLFSGTPCQCAGLKNYLGKDYDNLLIIDVLCHGVPSPKLFKDYLSYLAKQYGNGKPISVNFRNKQRGWKRLYMEVKFDNGKRHFMYSGYDRYEGMFLNNMSLRPSCYECKFTKTERLGDITLGDFWGIGKKHPQWDDDKGISLVMVNTPKGERLWESVADRFEGKIESIDLAKAGQRTIYAPTVKNPNRNAFYDLYTTKGIEKALETYTNVPNAVVRAYYAVMRKGLDVVRKILRRGY